MHVAHTTHTGRGGAGNVRSPSREPRDFGEYDTTPGPVRTRMLRWTLFRSGVRASDLVGIIIRFVSEHFVFLLAAEAVQADYEHKVIENADAKPHAVVRSSFLV